MLQTLAEMEAQAEQAWDDVHTEHGIREANDYDAIARQLDKCLDIFEQEEWLKTADFWASNALLVLATMGAHAWAAGGRVAIRASLRNIGRALRSPVKSGRRFARNAMDDVFGDATYLDPREYGGNSKLTGWNAPKGTAPARANAFPQQQAELPTPQAGSHSTFKPGPFATDSIAARSTAQQFTSAERAAVNQIGRETGCYTCGATDPGTKSGNFVPDHQPPSSLAPIGTPQRLYPHCIKCSREQGLAIARTKKAGR